MIASWKSRDQNFTVLHPSQSIQLGDLEPSTDYVIDVCPFNDFGDGPCQKVSASTLAEGRYFY